MNSTDSNPTDPGERPDAVESDDQIELGAVGGLTPEEDWEHEIAALLGGLDPISPPDGFIDQAIDHRPLYAGRTLLFTLAAGAVAVAIAAVALTDHVVPPVEQLSERHSAAEADLFGSVLGSVIGSDDGEVTFQILGDSGSEEMVEMNSAFEQVMLPDDYVVHAVSAAGSGPDDMPGQAIFTSADGAVSVFSERGEVDFTDMPAEGLRQVAGNTVWFDASAGVAVMQVGASVVTLVGADESELERLVASLSPGSPSLVERINAKVNRLTAELGFVDMG